MSTTTTTLAATTKSTNVFVGVREGHANLFFRSVRSSSSTARTAVPLEVFLKVMAHVRYRAQDDEHDDNDDNGGSESDEEEEPEQPEGEGGGGPAVEAKDAALAKVKLKVKGGEADLIRASQVCFGWRNAILGCGRLWSELKSLRAASFNGVERARAVAQRSKVRLSPLSLPPLAGS